LARELSWHLPPNLGTITVLSLTVANLAQAVQERR